MRICRKSEGKLGGWVSELIENSLTLLVHFEILMGAEFANFAKNGWISTSSKLES